MGTTEDLPAARIRERRAKPMRPPWTYRCYLSRGDAVIDVDAFTLDEAVALAASYWNIDADRVDVEGRRRWWMRWIGCSTHRPEWDHVPRDRGWWLACKFALGGVLCFVLALPIGLVGGEVVALHIKARQAELERLESEAETLATETPVAAEDGSGHSLEGG